ncbi:MAG: hypothetical protein JRJ78_17175, partial [Deltaproteobacteria bacterium]|nr:hypothetical protein [Deltaproteobacteria bacterium]
MVANLFPVWLKRAGADPEVIDRIRLEVKPLVDLAGLNYKESAKQWAEQGVDTQEVFGATTIGKMKAVVQLATSLQ